MNGQLIRSFLLPSADEKAALAAGSYPPTGANPYATMGDLGSPVGAVPIGGIIMWSGTIAGIPSPTWELCDGTANSPGPDLRNKFVVGADADDAGVAKSTIDGTAHVTGGVTGHGHSSHAALSHSSGAVGDHTGLTHGLTIGTHPDLTHAAVGTHIGTAYGTHPSAGAATYTHASHGAATYTHPSFAAATYTHASVASVAARSGSAYSLQTGTASRISVTLQTGTIASYAANTHADHSIAAYAPADHSVPAHAIADHSVPAHTIGDHGDLTHVAPGDHVGTVFGSHAVTAPAGHGTAGTLTHSFTQPAAHTVSGHDTVSNLPLFYALAFIQRMQ